MKLNLACGNDYLEGFTNVDQNTSVKCDLVVDLEHDTFPWENNSIDIIFAKMIVEHIRNRDRFMNECWRILKPEATMYITTPTAGTVAYWKDPTHVSGWIEQTFRYYADWNTNAADKRKTWEIVSCDTYLIGDENEYIECVLKKP